MKVMEIITQVRNTEIVSDFLTAGPARAKLADNLVDMTHLTTL